MIKKLNHNCRIGDIYFMYDDYATNFVLTLQKAPIDVLERNKEWLNYLHKNRPEITSNFVAGRMSFRWINI